MKVLIKNQVKTFYPTSLDSLLCSLYTLSGSHKVFKKLDLKNDLHLDIKCFYKSKNNNFSELKNLLSKSALKQFALYLLVPVLDLNGGLNETTKNFNNDSYQIILLKKYMRKFQRNYRRYFFYQNGDYIILPTNKEINMYAIESLFLLAGI